MPLVKLIRSTYRLAGVQDGKVVLHNAAFLSGLQLISYILPVVILPYLFRVLGADRFGLICLAQALIQYFLIVTDYGFSVTATKEISIHRHDPKKVSEIFSSVMAIKTIFATISILLLCAIVFTVPKFRNEWAVYIFAIGAIVGNVLFPMWFFQGTEKMKHIAQLNILGEFVYAFFIFSFVKGPEDYLMVSLTHSIVPVITGIVAQVVVFRQFKVGLKVPEIAEVKHHLQLGWNMFISVVAINAYTTTRIFAVGILTNNTLTGFYSIAEKIANVVQTFPLSSFSQAIFPRLSSIYHKNKSTAYLLMQQIQLITIGIAIIIMPGIWMAAPWIIKIVCGSNQPEVVSAFRLLLISVFFVSANAFRVQFLLVSGRTDLYSKIHIGMAVFALPLILILIKQFSYSGAALATILIEGGIFALTYFVVKRLQH